MTMKTESPQRVRMLTRSVSLLLLAALPMGLLMLVLTGCASRTAEPQVIKVSAQRRQCPPYPLPAANLMRHPVRTDFLHPAVPSAPK